MDFSSKMKWLSDMMHKKHTKIIDKTNMNKNIATKLIVLKHFNTKHATRQYKNKSFLKSSTVARKKIYKGINKRECFDQT